MERDFDYLASLETLDNGMTFGMASAFTDLAIKNMRHMAGWADKIHGATIPVGIFRNFLQLILNQVDNFISFIDGPFMTFTRKEPIGVVGAIVAWNGPIILLSWKLGNFEKSQLEIDRVIVISFWIHIFRSRPGDWLHHCFQTRGTNSTHCSVFGQSYKGSWISTGRYQRRSRWVMTPKWF